MASFDFIEKGSGSGAGFIYKSSTEAHAYDGTSFIKITNANYPATTVRGIVYLDGTYYVMTPNAEIFGSDLENVLQWSALNVIKCNSEPDGGVCLARQLNLVVAFNKYSTEFFYDAANPVGSPLSPYTSSFLEIGCAVAESVTQMDNNLIFMSQGRQKGRSIQVLQGTVPSKISTVFVDKILEGDDLVNVRAYYIKLSGHGFYILQLPTSNITLVYDFDTQLWGKWTRITAFTDENTFTEVPFSISGYTTNGSADLVQDSTTGSIYALSLDTHKDDGFPIHMQIVTPLYDGGLNQFKFFSKIELIGDKNVGKKAFLSYSDDDYLSWSTKRPIDLGTPRSSLNRLGSSRRRAFKLECFEDDLIRFSNLEITLEKGAM